MKNYVITIERGFGSRGKSIGCELSKRLGIPCYEDEIMTLASEESGFNVELFGKMKDKNRKGETSKNMALIEMSTRITAGNDYYDVYSDENLFNFMAKIIRNKAISENCIILGNAANYVLRTYPNVLALNIQGPYHVCANEIVERYQVSYDEAAAMIAEIDTKRANFYKYFTGRKWTDYKDYDAVLNPHRLGYEETIEQIINMLNCKMGMK